MSLSSIDIWVALGYAVFIFALAQWVSREKAGHEKNSSDYFLAGNSLPWWAIGASLIAANISAEQIIGMSGSAYVMGLAIASYEWMAAITLLIVGKYFLPVFLKHNIQTMPQFLEKRFDNRVRTVMAIFWLGVYVFVNLASILWLGALAINAITGVELTTALVCLGLFSAAYSIYGGLKAVAFTDIIQVVLLVIGGLMIAGIALDRISEGQGMIQGFAMLTEQLPEKFDMILSEDNPSYMSMPGLSVLVGGMWVMNLSYWGFNQYIIQRALAAKSTDEAQKGIAFAAFLKLLVPVLVVLPGIAAAMLYPELVDTPDQAYPAMMQLLPVGILGIVFAALIGAIVSSLASMMNSISTIATLDIYRDVMGKKDTSEHNLVIIGRVIAVAAMGIAMLIAQPLLGQFEQAFQYIQEFTGFFTPGIVVIFMMGLFWKKTNGDGALVAALGSALLSVAFKVFWPELPFMDRVGLVFLICLVLCGLVSMIRPQLAEGKDLSHDGISFSTGTVFNVSAIAITVVLAALYITWW